MATAAPAGTGRVIQITGPVVDIEFPAGKLPAIYNAVEIERKDQDPLVCEVQQHLGNNWVRAVAMTTTDGLARDLDRALRMPAEERKARHEKLLAAVTRGTALTWAEDFLATLEACGSRSDA